MKRIARLMPIITWLPRYDRAWLPLDVIAGLTVWALVVPESMAYAGIARVPVQYGLYAVPLAVLGYLVFGARASSSSGRARQSPRSRPSRSASSPRATRTRTSSS